jgi:hypothetical protein
LACLTKSLQVDSRYTGAWYIKAYLEKAMGDKDAAIASCGAYLGLKAGKTESQRGNVVAWLDELSQ